MSLISSTNALTSSGEFRFALTDSREDLFLSTDSLLSSTDSLFSLTASRDALSQSTDALRSSSDYLFDLRDSLNDPSGHDEPQFEKPKTTLEKREVLLIPDTEGYLDFIFNLASTEKVSHYLSTILTPILTKRGICMSNLLPREILTRIWKINDLLLLPRNALVTFFGLTKTQTSAAIAPVLEELEFRFILQQILLKKLPESILQKISGNKELHLDSLPHKIFRIFFTSLLFTAAHWQYAECDMTGGVPTFISSLIYSSIIETGNSILTPICLHLINNQLALLNL